MTGALIFAYNNESIDYVRMAAWSAKNIRRHLGIPVCLVTDKTPIVDEFDQVVYTNLTPSTNTRNFSDVGTVTWHNLNRMDAYSLSPWDQTLVLDADYIVASDRLKSLFDVDQDFLSHRWAYDITGNNAMLDNNYFGDYKMPMWWATVMLFRRSNTAELIFQSMDMIRSNWNHYRNIYHNSKSTYRNDHALSIALNIVNGHTLNHPGIPWDLASLMPGPTLTQVEQDSYRVDFITPEKKHAWIEIHNQDFHAMGKMQLGEIVANNT